MRPFAYVLDPVCLTSTAVYLLNRWFLKPHGIGGAFTHDYLNDVLCLPLFLPAILYVQRRIGLRQHDGPPRTWEILQHWAVFSLIFETILPRFPNTFRTTADPLDVVAYLAGGVIAGLIWRAQRSAPISSPGPMTALPPGSGALSGTA